MNYCFLNGAGFGDCAQVYSHYEGYVRLKNCSTDTTYHLNDLKFTFSMALTLIRYIRFQLLE